MCTFTMPVCGDVVSFLQARGNLQIQCALLQYQFVVTFLFSFLQARGNLLVQPVKMKKKSPQTGIVKVHTESADFP